MLMQKAEEIAKQNNKNKIVIISASCKRIFQEV